MRPLRSKWVQRCLVVVLMASFMPAYVVTASRAPQPAETYAGWLRVQLREPAGPAVNQALEAALESRARSLEAFLVAFVEAYEAAGGGDSLARVFVPYDLSNEALITYLQGQYRGVGSEAVPPRHELSASSVIPAHLKTAALPVVSHGRKAASLRLASHGVMQGRLAACPIWVLSAAQPLGP